MQRKNRKTKRNASINLMGHIPERKNKRRNVGERGRRGNRNSPLQSSPFPRLLFPSLHPGPHPALPLALRQNVSQPRCAVTRYSAPSYPATRRRRGGRGRCGRTIWTSGWMGRKLSMSLGRGCLRGGIWFGIGEVVMGVRR
jgi:hypothetical protein